MPAIFTNYALGVNAAKHPRLLADGELRMLVNGTVSSGFVEPRPPFLHQQPLPTDALAAYRFTHGLIQGTAYYASERGPALIIAADGWLLSLALADFTLRTLGHKAFFSSRAAHIYLCQRGPYMLAQDGTSPPVIIRGHTATPGTHPTRGVPTGTLMAEGWGRLVVASPCRTKLYFSNHLADPGTDSQGRATDAIAKELRFTEDTAYFKNIRHFRVPQAAGSIVGMTFTPSLNGDGDLGPLVVFCERSTWLYNTRVPREQWGEQDIASNPLPFIGACSPDAIAVRGNDVIFSDQSGRIQQMRIAVRRNDDARLKEHDAAIKPLLANDHSTQLHRRLACHLRGRHTLIAHSPEAVRYSAGRHQIRHRRILALNESPAVEADPVWDGLWTGVHPVTMTVAPWQGLDTAFIISLDSDGQNRLYRLGNSPGPDLAAVAHRGTRQRHQPTLAITRADTLEAPFTRKTFDSAALHIGNAHGPIRIHGAWLADGLPPQHWFSDHHHIPDALTCQGFPQPQDLLRITTPAPPAHSFLSVSAAITIEGQARLEEIAIDAQPYKTPSNLSTQACTFESHPAITACPLAAYTYDLSKPTDLLDPHVHIHATPDPAPLITALNGIASITRQLIHIACPG